MKKNDIDVVARFLGIPAAKLRGFLYIVDLCGFELRRKPAKPVWPWPTSKPGGA